MHFDSNTSTMHDIRVKMATYAKNKKPSKGISFETGTNATRITKNITSVKTTAERKPDFSP